MKDITKLYMHYEGGVTMRAHITIITARIRVVWSALHLVALSPEGRAAPAWRAGEHEADGRAAAT